MIVEFQYYIDNNLARKASPDKGEAEALLQKAEGRLDFSIKVRRIDENTATYIFEDIYECLREAAQHLEKQSGLQRRENLRYSLQRVA